MTEPIELPFDLPFEEWVRYVFEHEVEERPWFWNVNNRIHWDEDADRIRTLSYITRLFRDPEVLIGVYSKNQIDQGLDFLSNSSFSSYMLKMANSFLPWQNRLECIEALLPLYGKLIAPVYCDLLSHQNTIFNRKSRRENEFRGSACYMFWEGNALHPFLNDPDGRQVTEALLGVFAGVLTFKSEACLESVLHALGHWYNFTPQDTLPLVNRFLERQDISPAIRKYAERALHGNVQ